MIEAVNSVLANASLVRGNTNQIDAARAPAVDTEGVSAPTAPFISPFIALDNNFDTAVLQIRDSETGDVLRQFPSETTLATRARQEQLAEIRQSNAEQRVTSTAEFETQVLQSANLNAPVSPAETATINVAAAQQASAALSSGAAASQAQSGTVNITA